MDASRGNIPKWIGVDLREPRIAPSQNLADLKRHAYLAEALVLIEARQLAISEATGQ
jgi:hypothetical protein